MRRQHINPTQRIKANEFRPIMRDEIPYYENLNRAARSAYNYADEINNYLSYGGFANVIQPGVDPATHTFKLYEIVKISDDELALPLNLTDPDSTRVGIIVAEAKVDPITGAHTDLIVCTFCQNFVYPNRLVDSLWGPAPTSLYLSTDAATMYLSPNPTEGLPDGSIGLAAIATKVGACSIAFNGTVHSNYVLNAENAVNAMNTTVLNDSFRTQTVFPTWVDAATGNLQQKVSFDKLRFVPSTGTLSATVFSGSGSGLTNLQAPNLEGILPATCLNTHSFYLGTSQIALTRTSGEQALSGITGVDGTNLNLGVLSASNINIGTGINPTYINIGNQDDSVAIYGSTLILGSNGITVDPSEITIGAGTTPTNIVIGGIGDTVTINGTVTWTNTENLEVTDKLIRLNKGAGSGTANGAGIEIEESGFPKAAIVIGNNSSSWLFTVPAAQGAIQITPSLSNVVAEIDAHLLTANRSYSLPDNSGTLALITDTIGSANTVSLIDDVSTSTDVYPVWSSGFSGSSNQLKVSAANLKFNPSSGTVTATTFIGSLTGNASTAGKLNSPVNINGVAFDGSAPITVTANTAFSITAGNGLSGGSFNGSASVTLAVSAPNTTVSSTRYPVFADAQGTSVNLGTSSGLYFDPATRTLYADNFSGLVSGTSENASNISGGSAGCLWYNTAASTTTSLPIAPVNRILMSSGSAPVWSSVSYPTSTTANRLLYSSSANIISEVATQVYGVVATNGSGTPLVVAGSNGVLMGSSSTNPAFTMEPQVTTNKLAYGYSTSGLLTTTDITPSQFLDSSDITTTRSIKYLVSVSSGSSFYMTEVSIIHDGVNAYTTQYGTIHSGSILATFDASIVGSTLYLRTTPANASTTYKFIKTAINV